MITPGWAAWNRRRRSAELSSPAPTARFGWSLMAAALVRARRRGYVRAAVPAMVQQGRRTPTTASWYVPLSHACSPGRLRDRDAGGPLRPVRVHREQHGAEHDGVVRVELGAQVRDEL